MDLRRISNIFIFKALLPILLLMVCFNGNAQIDGKTILKSFFLQEMNSGMMKKLPEDTEVDDFFANFDFRMRVAGSTLGSIDYYVVDSFVYANDSFKIVDVIDDTCKFVVAIHDNDIFRLKGFSVNDFPFFLKRVIESGYANSDVSVRSILEDLSLTYNVESNVELDFDCLYEAFRAKELNYDDYPCLQSYWVAQSLCMQTGYNGMVVQKKGGEPVGYRRTKLDKKYIIVKPYTKRFKKKVHKEIEQKSLDK